MCLIVDINVLPEVFGDDPPEAGKKFFEHIVQRRTKLVIGGKLLDESINNQDFAQWLIFAERYDLVTEIDREQVERRTKELERSESCASNDAHIIALAQCANARLLYSNDRDLQKDFNNPRLINKPRGKVYPIRSDGAFTPSHRKLLQQKNLCRNKG